MKTYTQLENNEVVTNYIINDFSVNKRLFDYIEKNQLNFIEVVFNNLLKVDDNERIFEISLIDNQIYKLEKCYEEKKSLFDEMQERIYFRFELEQDLLYMGSNKKNR